MRPYLGSHVPRLVNPLDSRLFNLAPKLLCSFSDEKRSIFWPHGCALETGAHCYTDFIEVYFSLYWIDINCSERA